MVRTSDVGRTDGSTDCSILGVYWAMTIPTLNKKSFVIVRDFFHKKKMKTSYTL